MSFCLLLTLKADEGTEEEKLQYNFAFVHEKAKQDPNGCKK